MTNNRDYVDAIVALGRILSGEKDVEIKMEKEGQDFAIRNCRVARRMTPCKEEWEKLGFEFTDIDGDNMLCYAKLPEGWSLQKTEHQMWNDIIDQNGLKRASMFYKAACYDRDAFMDLLPRYKVDINFIQLENGYIKEIYFGNEQEKIFVAGEVLYRKDASDEEHRNAIKESKRLLEVANKFAEENYPNWKDINAYWDIESPKVQIKK